MTAEERVNKIARENPKVRVCTFSILHSNEFCIELFIDAMKMIKKTDLFKHELKKSINCAERYRKAYEKSLNGTISMENSEFLADSNDKMDEELSRLENVFYYQIKQELDRYKINNSAEIAKLEECNIMLLSTLKAHDEAIDVIFKAGIGNVNREYLRLTSMQYYVNKAIEQISYTKPISLDTQIITTAYNNLIGTLFSARVINKTIEE